MTFTFSFETSLGLKYEVTTHQHFFTGELFIDLIKLVRNYQQFHFKFDYICIACMLAACPLKICLEKVATCDGYSRIQQILSCHRIFAWQICTSAGGLYGYVA